MEALTQLRPVSSQCNLTVASEFDGREPGESTETSKAVGAYLRTEQYTDRVLRGMNLKEVDALVEEVTQQVNPTPKKGELALLRALIRQLREDKSGSRREASLNSMVEVPVQTPSTGRSQTSELHASFATSLTSRNPEDSNEPFRTSTRTVEVDCLNPSQSLRSPSPILCATGQRWVDDTIREHQERTGVLEVSVTCLSDASGEFKMFLCACGAWIKPRVKDRMGGLRDHLSTASHKAFYAAKGIRYPGAASVKGPRTRQTILAEMQQVLGEPGCEGRYRLDDDLASTDVVCTLCDKHIKGSPVSGSFKNNARQHARSNCTAKSDRVTPLVARPKGHMKRTHSAPLTSFFKPAEKKNPDLDDQKMPGLSPKVDQTMPGLSSKRPHDQIDNWPPWGKRAKLEPERDSTKEGCPGFDIDAVRRLTKGRFDPAILFEVNEYSSRGWGYVVDRRGPKPVLRSTCCQHGDTTGSGGKPCVACIVVFERPTNQFKSKLWRLDRSNDASESHVSKFTNNSKLSPRDLAMKLERVSRKVRSSKKGTVRVQSSLETEKTDPTGHATTNAVVSAAKSLGRRLKKDPESAPGLESKLQAITGQLKNANRKNHGQRYERQTQQLYAALLITGGPRAADLVGANQFGPSISSVRRWLRTERLTFRYGIDQTNIDNVSTVISELMEMHGINGPVPVLLAEDETSIQPRIEYDQRWDSAVGYCGNHCEGRCETTAKCGCTRKHRCDVNPTPRAIGTSATAYEDTVKEFTSKRVAKYLRAIMVNFLDPRLPSMTLALLPTCNSFDAEGYVMEQWKLIESMWAKTGRQTVGPITTHSSDGDARRRRLQLQLMLRSDGDRYKLGIDSFTHSARLLKYTTPSGEEHVYAGDMGDQDYLHIIKKAINRLQSSSAVVQVGQTGIVHLNVLIPAVNGTGRAAHGVRRDDLSRKGFKAMDVPSAVRLISPVFLRFLSQRIDNGDAHLAATHRYLTLVRCFASIFISKKISMSERVTACAKVVTYLRLWRGWIYASKNHTLKENFITRECYQDIIMSCHYAVLAMMSQRDHFGVKVKADLSRAGSDCCENLFSMLGGMHHNRRVYTTMHAMQQMSNIHHMLRLKATSSIVFKDRAKHRAYEWLDEATLGDMQDEDGIPGEGEMLRLWKKGVAAAREMCAEDGMDGRVKSAPKVFKEYWSKPWTDEHDPKAKVWADMRIEEDEERLSKSEDAECEERKAEGCESQEGRNAWPNNQEHTKMDAKKTANSIADLCSLPGIQAAEEICSSLLAILTIRTRVRLKIFNYTKSSKKFELASNQIAEPDTANLSRGRGDALTISIGKISIGDSNHYVELKDTITEPKQVKHEGLIRGDAGYFGGVCEVIEVHGMEPQKMEIVDRGMYPWGRWNENGDVMDDTDEKLKKICDAAGVYKSQGTSNTCAYTHCMSVLLREGIFEANARDLEEISDNAALSRLKHECETGVHNKHSSMSSVDPTLPDPLKEGAKKSKMSLLRELHEAPKVSADILIRVRGTENSTVVTKRIDFETVSATHKLKTVGLGDDVYMNFDDRIWVAKILRMRRMRPQSTKNKQRKPEELCLAITIADAEVRATVEINCSFYGKAANTLDTYSYGDPQETEYVLGKSTERVAGETTIYTKWVPMWSVMGQATMERTPENTSKFRIAFQTWQEMNAESAPAGDE